MPATVDDLAAVALELAVRVRDEDPVANGHWLAGQLPDPADWFRLSFILAAAVPDDRPWSDLTGWIDEPAKLRPDTPGHDAREGLQPCGTRAAYRRHLKNGEKTCQPCRDAAARHKRRFQHGRRTA